LGLLTGFDVLSNMFPDSDVLSLKTELLGWVDGCDSVLLGGLVNYFLSDVHIPIFTQLLCLIW